MPSIVVDLYGSRRDGMQLLGECYNQFFMARNPLDMDTPLHSPVQVLDNTFREVERRNGVVFHVYGGVANELIYKGITGGGTGNKVKFEYKSNASMFPAQRKKVKIEPRVDNFDPAEPEAYVMLAVFSNKRTDLLLEDYLETTVTDIATLATTLDILSAKKYTLAALTFSRCK